MCRTYHRHNANTPQTGMTRG
jgi:hypothetical protein